MITLMEANALLAVAAAATGDIDELVEQTAIIGDTFDDSIRLQLRNRIVNLRDGNLIAYSLDQKLYWVTPKGLNSLQEFLDACANTQLWASKLIPGLRMAARKKVS